ncbi:MAG: hypothetical protein PHI59_00630 [Candidatus Omnitrophica bacterium]|nr:hypothetical protein [Candidatus Omnitrophota bacterium]
MGIITAEDNDFLIVFIILATYVLAIWCFHFIFVFKNKHKFESSSACLFYLLFGGYDVGLPREWHKYFKEGYYDELEKSRRFFAKAISVWLIMFFLVAILWFCRSCMPVLMGA